MNILTLLAGMSQAAWIGIIASVVIPGLSAWVVREHWDASITGIVTLGLSSADGFFTEWAKDGSDFNWKMGVALTIGSWVIAAIVQSKILSGTQFEAWLLALGSRLKISDADEIPDADNEASDPTLSLPPEDQVSESEAAGKVASDSQIAAPPSS